MSTESHPVILIVEDEEYLNKALLCAFEDEDFTVFSALDGNSALQLLKSRPIDVCIADMRLPDMTGNEFIASAKTAHPELQFIIFTGSIDYSIPRNLRDIGITREHVFIKPIEDLNSLIDAAVQAYRKMGQAIR